MGGVARFRFVGVGIDTYEHFDELSAVAEVQAVADLMALRGFEVVVSANVDMVGALAALTESLPRNELMGGALFVLWSGHGERTDANELRLIVKDSLPGESDPLTGRYLLTRAVATWASQLLVVLDTCFSGGALPSASDVVEALREAFPDRLGWVGVLASARAFEQSEDSLFAHEFLRVLRDGPRDPRLRLRFNVFEAGVRGDDVIDAVVQEWPSERQRPDARQAGVPRVMFANPLVDPEAPEEQVVEHLLVSAEGRGSDEVGDFFTGRVGPLGEVVSWFASRQPGVFVVTGVAGCGKSALVGRLVSLSNPTQRRRLVEGGAYLGPDPGEGSIHAHVHARRLTVDEVAGLIDAQLRHQRLLTASTQERNTNELLGAIQRTAERGALQGPLRVVIDSLDEAEMHAEPIVEDLVKRLARFAQVLVATRPLKGSDGQDLLAAMVPHAVIDLGGPEWRDDTLQDLRAYIRKRLAG